MKEWDIGVDIVDVARFRQLDYFSRKHFYERIFTSKEIEYCLSFEEPAQHFAVTFAAKEAVYKAMNRFYNAKLNEIEVLRDIAGAPYINIRPNRKIAKSKSGALNQPFEIRVSMSHSTSYAVAFAMVSSSERALRNFKLHIENGVLT